MTRDQVKSDAAARRAEVAEMRKSDMTLKAIGEKLGISEARVWQIAHHYTKVYQRRTKSEMG